MAAVGELSAKTREALARGAALYNRGLYWESHEAWEEAWLVEQGDVRVFLQGLIQVAAGWHKATVQLQPNGCVKLLQAGLDKLESVPAAMGGLDVARFVARVEDVLGDCVRWQAGELKQVDHTRIPAIELAPP